MSAAIVLHSGGMDSSVALLLARREGRDPLSLGIDYGQLHSVELLYANQLCRRESIPRRVLEVKWDLPPTGIPRNRELDEMRSAGPSPAFLPARNAVFLILAAAQAAGMGATELWLGVNALDYSGYPDCRPQFLAAFEAMLAQALPDPPRVVAPLVDKTKPQIAALARELGIGPGDTWSCYDPQIGADGVTPCRICDACKLHAYAWEQANSGT
jgi:7-cyano-7-deazaguanine synthase